MYAYTEDGNFDYINQILAKLNSKNECQLPTYEEIDELNVSFRELEKHYRSPERLSSILSDDQKLVRATVLDQWDSFQKRMTSDIVIRTAKKRSFLCKIEAYQTTKFGFSICINTFDATKKSSDRIFEKNSIVRYVKHTETNEVVNFDDVDEIDQTSTVDDDSLAEKPSNGGLSDEENYDPLADIPTPPAADQEIVEPSIESNLDGTPHVAEPTTTTTTPLPTLERPDLPETTPASKNDDDIESQLVEGEDIPLTESLNKAGIDALFEDQNSSPPSRSDNDRPNSLGEHYTEDGAELVDEFEDERDLARLDRVEPNDWDYDHVYGEFKWPDEHPFDNVCNFDRSIEIRWAKFMKNPFEYKDDFDYQVQQPLQPQPQLQPTPRLQSQFKQLPQQEQKQPIPPPPNPPEQRRSRQKPQVTGNLRMRKKEFLKSMQFSKRMYESDANLGFIDEPNADIMPSRSREHLDMIQNESDPWKTLVDNNFCKFSYNRDYIGNTRPLKAMKGLLGSSSKKKKSLIS